MIDFDLEVLHGHPQLWVAGVDEVGRGCLAGPVVAAAVVLPDVIDVLEHPWVAQVTDSKKLSAAQRENLAPLLMGWVRAYGLGVASVEEIDEINIHHASHLAMVRALQAMGHITSHILIDGKFLPQGIGPATAVIKGDSRCLSIACASIIAKVWRDQLMERLDLEVPGYFFSKHKGYGTPVHKKALTQLGPSLHHRRSFAPVRELLTR